MPVNEFLPFALSSGANVATQSTWANEVSRNTGFEAGVAKSSHLNKVWRQSAFVSHVLAQVIMEATNADVLDNGDIATLKARMNAAIKAVAGTKGVSDELALYKKVVDGLFASTNGNVSNLSNALAAAVARIVELEKRQNGRFIKFSQFANPGSFTHVFAEETNTVLYEVIAGGGAGGGGNVPGAGQCTVAGGGGAGGFTAGIAYNRKDRIGTSIGIVVGAGGTPTTGTGGSGGNSVFGGYATSLGGGGGFPLGPTTQGLGGAGAGGAAGSVYREAGFSEIMVLNQGAPGQMGIIISASQAVGGAGAAGPFGGGAHVNGAQPQGFNAASAGAGGGGCRLVGTQGPAAGGIGGNGLIRIWEYT